MNHRSKEINFTSWLGTSLEIPNILHRIVEGGDLAFQDMFEEGDFVLIVSERLENFYLFSEEDDPLPFFALEEMLDQITHWFLLWIEGRD
jgi:hypothetical protein